MSRLVRIFDFLRSWGWASLVLCALQLPLCAASSDKSASGSTNTSTLPSLGTARFQLGEPSAPDQLLVKQQDQINHLERT